ncbi:hypothetical protein HJFPF1_07020 [Paramyrothecium foliicola]|nr:hypothetical protein HJFPF1_07020 [Paramyrothecium foliicola]
MLFGRFPSHSDEVEYYGYRFRWSSRHRSAQELEPLRHTSDIIANAAIARIDELSPAFEICFHGSKKCHQQCARGTAKRHRQDYFKLAKRYAKDGEDLSKFWDEVNTVPSWVDWDQIERGQRVFWRYGGASITALTFLSLLGGMANGKSTDILDRTKSFEAGTVRRRMLETFQHTLGVHKDLASIMPEGEGWEACVRVRLLHASVRRRILQLAHERPDYYDTVQNGVPINDLDCMATISTFCPKLVYLGYSKQGIFLREQEIQDYHALWRYIAYLMGAPHDWLSSSEKAKLTMESIMSKEYSPTPASIALANNIITGFKDIPPTYASKNYLNALVWWMNGDKVAQDLEIEKPSIYYTALVASQCGIFMLNAYLCRTFPYLDNLNIRRIRKRLYHVFVEDKENGALGYKAKFTYKWAPSLTYTSPTVKSQGQLRHFGMRSFRQAGVERPALITLILAGGILSYAAYNVAEAPHIKRHAKLGPKDRLGALKFAGVTTIAGGLVQKNASAWPGLQQIFSSPLVDFIVYSFEKVRGGWALYQIFQTIQVQELRLECNKHIVRLNITVNNVITVQVLQATESVP